MGRVLALDLGSVRIGVAVTDPTRTLASPVEVVRRSGDLARDHQRLAAIVAEWEAERVVVGLPLSLDGSVGPAARLVLDEFDDLAATLGVPAETYDERLTTVTAHRQLRAAGRTERQRRNAVDAAAAAVLLEAWLSSTGRTSEDL